MMQEQIDETRAVEDLERERYHARKDARGECCRISAEIERMEKVRHQLHVLRSEPKDDGFTVADWAFHEADKECRRLGFELAEAVLKLK